MDWREVFLSRRLVDLRSGVSGRQLLFSDGVFYAFLDLLAELFLIEVELLHRSLLCVFVLLDLRSESTVLKLRVDNSLALFVNFGEPALLPLLKTTVIVLPVLKLSLKV